MAKYQRMGSAPKTGEPILIRRHVVGDAARMEYHVVLWDVENDEWHVSNGQDTGPLLGPLPDKWRWSPI